MAKAKGKSGKGRSISTVKKTNIKRNKLVKAGKLKPRSKPRFVEGGQFKKKSEKGKKRNDGPSAEEAAERQKEVQAEKKEREDAMYREMIDMVDPEDLEYLRKNASRGKAFNFASGVATEKPKKPPKRPKKVDEDVDDGDDDMDDYEVKAVKRIKAARTGVEMTRSLLPVRSRDGWQQRSIKVQQDDGAEEESSEENEELDKDQDEDDTDANEGPVEVSVIDILVKRKKMLENAKIQIGSMSANFLEKPEERMHLLDRLIRMMALGESDASIESTVIKMASASIVEILKDIVPNYRIADHESADKSVKLKKDTLRLHKFETLVVASVKRFLVKCERIVSGAKADKSHIMAPHCLRCMLELLVAHPDFNYSENVIQFAVPFLTSANDVLRGIAREYISRLFHNDKKGYVTMLAVRSINHHLRTKKHKVVRPDMVNVLLSLKLYHLENPKDIATAHLNGQEKRKREGLSKKERKLAKAKAKLEKELLESKAEESAESRKKYAAEITNLLFAIYFRLIKDEATVTSNLLKPVLTGLSKFGHLMSIDYFQDLLRVLSGLLDRKVDVEDENVNFLDRHEALLCIHAVLAILSGQGGQLTLDPERFYSHLDRVITQLCYEHEDKATVELAVKVLREAFIVRRKKVSRSVLIQALKRVATACLQNSGLLAFLKEAMAIHPQSVSDAVLCKDGDDEASCWRSTLLPNNSSDIIKEPLLWELIVLSGHYEAPASKASDSILGWNKNKIYAELKRPNGVEFDQAEKTNESGGFIILDS